MTKTTTPRVKKSYPRKTPEGFRRLQSTVSNDSARYLEEYADKYFKGDRSVALDHVIRRICAPPYMITVSELWFMKHLKNMKVEFELAEEEARERGIERYEKEKRKQLERQKKLLRKGQNA